MYAQIPENKFNKWISFYVDLSFRYLTLFLIISFVFVEPFASLYTGIDTREGLLGNIKWKSCTGLTGLSDVGFWNHALVFTPHQVVQDYGLV